MKYSSQMFFGQPVMRDGSDDYTSSSFRTEVSEVTLSNDEVFFEIQSSLDSSSLNMLIDEGLAAAAIYLTCEDTRINRLLPLKLGTSTEIRFPAGKLFGRVKILPLLYSTKETPDWRTDELSLIHI